MALPYEGRCCKQYFPPSALTATSGVRIQGATVAANGTPRPGAATVVTCSSGRCGLTIAPYSAVLVTIP